jgi:hypothetical protein
LRCRRYAALDLLLGCASLSLAVQGAAKVSHAADVVGRVVRGVFLSCALDLAGGTREGFWAVLCVGLGARAVFGETRLGGSSEYIFADRVARSLGGDSSVGLGAGALLFVGGERWLGPQAKTEKKSLGLVFQPRFLTFFVCFQMRGVARMVAGQLANQWVVRSAPAGLGYVSGLLLAYLCAPLLAGTEAGEGLLGFLVYRAAGALDTPGPQLLKPASNRV